ncbi:hypothetical protein GCM10020000_79460 [Streptomyces olivoverticillatus]
MQIDTRRAPGRSRASAAATGSGSGSLPPIGSSMAATIRVSAVAITLASCSTAIEKSSLVRTGRPSGVQVSTS